VEYANAANTVDWLRRLLRTRRNRPRRRSTHKRDEIASSHCLHQGRDYAE